MPSISARSWVAMRTVVPRRFNSENNRIICEKTVQPGSLFRLTTCKSVAERAQREQDSKNALEAAQNHVEIGLGSAAAAQ